MSTHLKMTVLDDRSVYLITFDRPGSGANILDVAALHELDDVLKRISGDSGALGVIFTSAKPSIFIAGADINELAGVKSESELLDLVKLGQQVMQRIADLRAVTVAAIHGACLGGGCELTLACDYRLASRDRATQIGLPETGLGILPCWGGATRLPRLIGLPKALDLVLNGKKLAAVPALKTGLVDELIPREHLTRFALEYVDRGKPARAGHALVHNPVAAGIIARRARALAQRKTRGHYPALPAALDVMTRGVLRPIAASLELEQQAIAALAATPACRNLIRIFQLQDRAKKLGAGRPPPARRAAVIGAGVMGAGIAQWLAARGIAVALRDLNDEQVRKGMAACAKLFADAARKHILDPVAARRGMERVAPAGREIPLRNMDVVIEAAVEQIEAKKKIFARLAEWAGPDTVLATNTSALSITEIAAATRAPERVVGLHFFNPVHRMQLVEVVVGERTAPDTVTRAIRFVQQIGKLPVVARDQPGFIVNRILMPYLVEAGLLFERGAAARDLDECMLDFGMPMGPLRLLDEVGVDVAHHVATELSLSYRTPVPALLGTMIERGWLGRKAGRGFYVYGPSGEPALNPELSSGAGPRIPRDELQRRMVLLMINEAARCVEEQVAESPADVDFAMILGTGFAPFRGGPLRYADSQGITQIQEELARRAKDDPRFTPSARLTRMSVEGTSFYPDAG